MDVSRMFTTRNLTILGILTIAGAIINAAICAVGGQPVNLEATLTAVSTGIGMIMAKGASNTGGTVPSTPEAAKRIQAGFISFQMALILAAFAIGILAVCPRVRADEPAPGLLPQIAVCNAGNTVCLAPSVSFVPYTVDLSTGKIGPSILFQVGEGVTIVKGSVAYGVDILLGTSTDGGWNAAFMGKVGPKGLASFHIGPVILRRAGAYSYSLGFGAGY